MTELTQRVGVNGLSAVEMQEASAAGSGNSGSSTKILPTVVQSRYSSSNILPQLAYPIGGIIGGDTGCAFLSAADDAYHPQVSTRFPLELNSEDSLSELLSTR